jgi:hypothetical protein
VAADAVTIALKSRSYQGAPVQDYKCTPSNMDTYTCLVKYGSSKGTWFFSELFDKNGQFIQESLTDQNGSSTLSQPQQQPSGLTLQQKIQILFKFCTSSQMRGPVGDSSAFPLCMSRYYVTDQGMVMPK